MTLSQSRIELRGHSEYPWEQEAIEFAIDVLPNNHPYRIWCLIDFQDASTGRLSEIDMLILGYSALYLVEAKGHPGRFTGDSTDWWRDYEGRRHYMESPYRLTNSKAKILAGHLKSKLQDRKHSPFVQPLVFLSHESAELEFDPGGNTAVVTRKNFLRAIQYGEVPGVTAPRQVRPISKPAATDITQALAKLGFRASKGRAQVGSYELGTVTADGPGYQDRDAQHRDQKHLRRRARIYLVPSQTTTERRAQLRRAAERESVLLHDIRDHSGVLSINDYVADAPLGPTVMFDDFEGSIPLDAFIRQHRKLTLAERVDLITQVGRALAHCHDKGIIHGGLSPDAVLARKNADGSLETRLYNLQLGYGEDTGATSHWTALASSSWMVYQAPEFLQNSHNRTVAADVFALGALAYFVLTGAAPAIDLVEATKTLQARQCFDPLVATDRIPDGVAEVVALATQVSFAARADNVTEWVELLNSEARPPEPASPADETPPTDPLSCEKGDTLCGASGDLYGVVSILGHGASARGILVNRVTPEGDERQLVLKVSLSPEHDTALAGEGDVLENLRHSQIVTLLGRDTIADRPCLLLSRAGQDNLHDELAFLGALSLDFASRYGDQLLNALEYLENQQVLHRDIKPANIGVGSANKKQHDLTLFDFSLAIAPLSSIAIGTSVYRDPFLLLRGQWDHAADRYSVAVTLHEMLSNVRPSYGEAAAIDPNAELRLAAERFDSAVRGKLVAFFTAALAKDLESRHGSAREMRTAWNQCFSGEDTVPPPVADVALANSDAAIAAITPDAPIESLPLSVRAKNALDRAGLSRTADLLALADNRVSAIRGIGTKVAGDILTFRDRWKALRAGTETSPSPTVDPFYPRYLGADDSVDVLVVDPAIANALIDAGLTSAVQLAAAPKAHLAALKDRVGIDPQALTRALDANQKRAREQAHPTSLEAWVDALVPVKRKKRKADTYVRQLYGLEEPMLGRIDVSAKDVAEAAGVTRPVVYIANNKAADVWAGHPSIDALIAQVETIAANASGIASLSDAATQLVATMAHEKDGLERARAAALIRIAIEVAKGKDETAIALLRINGTFWLSASDDHAAAARELGRHADGLAKRKILASSGETARLLGEAVAETVLQAIPANRVAALAAAASKNAALSSRLEIYPRGMSAERALELTAVTFTKDLSPAAIRGRVAARYPEAQPLPERPALDKLLSPYKLAFDAERERYVRPGESSAEPTARSTISAVHSIPHSLGKSYKPPPVGDVERYEFVDKIRSAIDRRRFRVLGVKSTHVTRAAIGLRNQFGLNVVSIDTLFSKHLAELTRAENIEPSIVYEIDRQGQAGPEWTDLLSLTRAVAAKVAAEIAAIDSPTVLINPGLFARYRLGDVVKDIVVRAKTEGEVPLLLLVPSRNESGVPMIGAALPIGGLERSDVLWIPHRWLGKAKANTGLRNN